MLEFFWIKSPLVTHLVISQLLLAGPGAFAAAFFGIIQHLQIDYIFHFNGFTCCTAVF
jgi:hypothetical protein